MGRTSYTGGMLSEADYLISFLTRKTTYELHVQQGM
jgi:hypothetical protein